MKTLTPKALYAIAESDPSLAQVYMLHNMLELIRERADSAAEESLPAIIDDAARKADSIFASRSEKRMEEFRALLVKESATLDKTVRALSSVLQSRIDQGVKEARASIDDTIASIPDELLERMAADERFRGKQGKQGKPGKVADIDFGYIDSLLSENIRSSIKEMSATEEKELTIDTLVTAIESLPDGSIPSRLVNGLERGFEKLASSVGSATRKYMGGGGDVVVAGSNIAVTRTTGGKRSISSTASSGTYYNDTVSGTINSSNTVFTVPNNIDAALFLALGNSAYQFGVDYTVTGAKEITMASAPDSSLSGQPFFLVHT